MKQPTQRKMESASDCLGIHVLLSAIKYLDREHDYGQNTGGKVPPEKIAIHKAIGTLTDHLPERVFEELLEERKEYWANVLKQSK